MKRAAIYARVSTKKQDETMQLQDLSRLAEARGWQLVGPEHIVRDESGLPFGYKAYVDRLSGKKELVEKRPNLKRLMEDARRRRFDVVMVWKFDRFARSLRHLVTALDEFSSLGIDFISHQESIDTSTPAGRLTFHVISAIAEFERDLIRERVIAGVHKARNDGKTLGRPTGLGRPKGARRLEVNPAEIFRLKAKGLSLRAISRAIGISHPTVATILRNGKNPSQIDRL